MKGYDGKWYQCRSVYCGWTGDGHPARCRKCGANADLGFGDELEVKGSSGTYLVSQEPGGRDDRPWQMRV